MTGRADDADGFGVNPGAATGPHMPEEEVAVMSTESGPVPQALLALAKAAAAPQLTDAALNRRFGPRSAWVPAAGQLWRAVREDVTALVVLLAVDAQTATVMPVTVEPSNIAGTVWVNLSRALPVSVLDRPVDDFGVSVLTLLAEWGTAGSPGAALLTDDVWAELDDDLTLLAAMSPAIAAPAVSADVHSLDLDALEPEALEEVAARLAVPLPVVLDLVDGKRPPTVVEAGVLREVLGASPEVMPPPAGLVLELSQPRWRGLVRQHRRGGPTEDAARGTLAYEVHAMAARQTGDAEPSWPDRIRRWAQAHQLDPDTDA